MQGCLPGVLRCFRTALSRRTSPPYSVSMANASQPSPAVGRLCLIGLGQDELAVVAALPQHAYQRVESLAALAYPMQHAVGAPMQPSMLPVVTAATPLDLIIIGPAINSDKHQTQSSSTAPSVAPTGNDASKGPSTDAPEATSSKAYSSRIHAAYWIQTRDGQAVEWGRSSQAQITSNMDHLVMTAQEVASQQQGGNITCDWCGLQGLTALGYHKHQPLYHIDHPNLAGTCQVCARSTQNIASHLHHTHMPPGRAPEERTGVFALAVVRRPADGRFLLTQEFACSGFWLPGGGVDPGESLQEGALREVREEAGLQVELRGVLCVEVHRGGQWRRVIFYAEPTGHGQSQAAKTSPDFDGAGACWMDASMLQELPLRSPSELQWVLHVAQGGSILPLEMPQQYASAFADWRF